jgi:hypothetical protein
MDSSKNDCHSLYRLAVKTSMIFTVGFGQLHDFRYWFRSQAGGDKPAVNTITKMFSYCSV